MYIVYKTINIKNDKIYIGVHQTNNTDDDYLGSGLILNHVIKKYGIDNFKRKIINTFKEKEDAYSLEKELVNEEFIKRNDTYNIRLGGNGGDGGEKCNQKISSKLKGREQKWLRSKEVNKKRTKTMYKKYGKEAFSIFKGRKHSKETIDKMKLSKKNFNQGSKNPQYGKCWIYSIIKEKNKLIQKSDLFFWLDKGWRKGRKMKF